MKNKKKIYSNDTKCTDSFKYWDRSALANSEDPDQTAP